MKLFQMLQKKMLILGLQLPEPGQKCSFELRKFMYWFLLVKFQLFLIIGILYKANSFNEYAESVYVIITCFNFSFVFCALIIKIGKVSELIHTFETLIEKSKFFLYQN